MIRRLLGLLAVGAVLAAGRSAVGEPLPTLVVPLGASVDEAILVDQGRRAGWSRADPLIRRRLADNLRFAGVAGEEDALVEAAHGLGMDQVDPVVRARLLDRARRRLAAVPEPTEAELEGWLKTHADRFAVGPIHQLTQVPLDAAGGARDLPGRLVGTEAQLEQRAGGDLASRAAGLSVGERAEVRSRWGRHEVVLEARSPRRVPALTEVRAAVVEHRAAALGDARSEERLVALRARYRVVSP